MLVLTRKAGETICIGDDIEVRIVGVRGQKVRLAIEAPRDVSVRRKELKPNDERLRLAEQEQASPSASHSASRNTAHSTPRAAASSRSRRAAS